VGVSVVATELTAHGIHHVVAHPGGVKSLLTLQMSGCMNCGWPILKYLFPWTALPGSIVQSWHRHEHHSRAFSEWRVIQDSLTASPDHLLRTVRRQFEVNNKIAKRFFRS